MKKLRLFLIFTACLSWMVTGGIAQALTLETTFSSLDEMFLGGGGAGVYELTDFIIHNDTGFTWTDFHVVDKEPLGPYDASSYLGPGTAVDGVVGVDIFDISILDGELLAFSLTEYCGIAEVCSMGGMIWYGQPTIDGGGSHTPVPEPGTILLLSAGLGGMVINRRKAKKKIRQ